MSAYPTVRDEFATLAELEAGRSIARYGDGEFKLMRGAERKSQRYSESLARRLREILQDSGACLVGIPNIRSATPKADFWKNYRVRWVTDMLADRLYYSSFITRPDSAPWIDRPDYWRRIRALWAGREVTLVRGSTKSLTADMLHDARKVHEIIGPAENAWDEYDALLRKVGRPERAIICLGLPATVMAVDLCARGVQALDLGHIGMFLKRAYPKAVGAGELRHA